MIPHTSIVAWRKYAPWATDAQVEQDLILSRALICLFVDELIAKSVVLRGGTALNKLFLPQPSRYSEDIDLVQLKAEPAGPLMNKIRSVLDPWLGDPSYKQTQGRLTFYYSFQSESPPIKPTKLKIEINTREHFSVYGYMTRKFKVKSDWFSREADVQTLQIDELMGTKLRALFQRKKGRDLFDLWLCNKELQVKSEKVVECFLHYMKHSDLPISRARFEENFFNKLADPAFHEDLTPLLELSTKYNFAEATEYVRQELLPRLPGNPWKGPGPA